jgi:hypothetical protein
VDLALVGCTRADLLIMSANAHFAGDELTLITIFGLLCGGSNFFYEHDYITEEFCFSSD